MRSDPGMQLETSTRAEPKSKAHEGLDAQSNDPQDEAGQGDTTVSGFTSLSSLVSLPANNDRYQTQPKARNREGK